MISLQLFILPLKLAMQMSRPQPYRTAASGGGEGRREEDADNDRSEDGAAVVQTDCNAPSILILLRFIRRNLIFNNLSYNSFFFYQIFIAHCSYQGDSCLRKCFV